MNVESPKFYLILRADDLDEGIENAVFEAGFDDSLLTMRGGHAAIWVTDRQGELTDLVREALAQAKKGGLAVTHVEIENEVFA
jgi:hypothetical protein